MEPLNVGRAKVALVSEVLDRLLAEYGTETARRSVLFQAALQACAEESKRIKQGQEPVPLAALVERAREILATPPGGVRLEPPPVTPPASPERPSLFPKPPQEESGGAPEPDWTDAPFSDFFVEPTPQVVVAPRPRRRTSRALLPAALGPVILAATALYLYVRPRVETSRGVAPAVAQKGPSAGHAARAPRDDGGAMTAAPTRLAVTAPTPPVVPTGPAAPAAGHPAGQRAPGVGEVTPREPESMVSPDWAGRPPTFVIHFSSYREREKAQRDAGELALRYHRPAYAARVTLPGGVWYRVLLGDFSTADAARAFHEDLTAGRTRELGGVFRIIAP